VFFGERFGAIRPRCSYIRSVCGCMPSSSAATPIMYLGVALLTPCPRAAEVRTAFATACQAMRAAYGLAC